ncbi:precorrin-3B C(17)-methyltransferase [Vallitalea guaymasensis]|uniref:Precorrin-3B C(17)-methyltransferase n=1 Tax=Vallitalea guaymasensis TaxID=1185412 RepID=A0A8J8SD89_9FIRM|nr:precorrin-3B C(17)-methyltransferase [Vallitalea guaymasensis]QUH30562.1 precorrin-3B C(17)-methyltransferase [Vallitalea guaymasensis]
MRGQIFVIGIGPGQLENMTVKAVEVIKSCDVIAGYKVYVEQVKDLLVDKKVISKGMGKEVDRCEMAIEEAVQGKKVGIVCSGDGGLYGMAGLLIELVHIKKLESDIDVEVVSGVTAAISCGALLGAPIVEDFCTISLSDYMTPYEKILKRVELASRGDFVIALYNPRSSKRPDYLDEALSIIRKERDNNTPVGIVRMAYREEQEIVRTDLAHINTKEVDMFCTIIIGNKQTKWINDFMVTSRGYNI